jgi:phosphoribosylformylglycinamidine cyclo-ligase
MTKPQGIGYSAAGVDTRREDTALSRLTALVQGTWPQGPGVGAVKLPIGYYANVIDMGPFGLAISADGVGTKVLIAQTMNRYDTVGIDCVAMNVNDLICVGARPVSMVDQIAVEDADPDMLEQIAVGLCDGARQAGVSIPGGEIAQVSELIKGSRPGFGFDLTGTAVGTVPLDRIIVGQDIVDGDVVVGVESNGIHSNGLTLARRTLLTEGGLTVESHVSELGRTLGEELLRPTHIYVREVLDILDQGIPVKALLHITSDGLLNLPRVASDTGYVIDYLPPPPPIFSLIREYGKIPAEEMFEVFNMGIGFCIVVPLDAADRVIETIGAHGKQAYRIGRTVHDPQRRVSVGPEGLVGQRGAGFHRA